MCFSFFFFFFFKQKTAYEMLRSLVGSEMCIRDRTERCSWMLTSRLAAQSEFEALTSLYDNVVVPQPIAHNRHVIVMSLLNGRELGNSTLEDPATVLENVIVQIKFAYGCGICLLYTSPSPRDS